MDLKLTSIILQAGARKSNDTVVYCADPDEDSDEV